MTADFVFDFPIATKEPDMFNKDRHYPLPETKWQQADAEQAIADIVDDVLTQVAARETLSTHPMDGWDSGPDLYLGRAGTFWAIDYLQRVGAVDAGFAVEPHLATMLAENREGYGNSPHSENSSYLFGELPILMMQYRAANSAEEATATAQEIATSIQINNDQPVRELMWGMAGSMLAARFMHQWTDDESWADLYRKQAELMLADWQHFEGIGYLWDIEVYGNQNKFLGPVHGFTGNALALMAGFALLTDSQTQQIMSRVMEATVNTAVTDDKFANWSAVFDTEKQEEAPKLVQYCHGAPGMIISLATLPAGENDAFDQILLKGGELTWHAGPLKKGSNLCHGTGGNGYAFLKLFERTGDEQWLERARLFAMHSIAQYRLAKQCFQQPRYPLWTGDPGLAIYLWDCIRAQAQFPTVDVF